MKQPRQVTQPGATVMGQLQALLQNPDQREGLCPQTTRNREEGRRASAGCAWGPRLRRNSEGRRELVCNNQTFPKLLPCHLLVRPPLCQELSPLLHPETLSLGPLATTSPSLLWVSPPHRCFLSRSVFPKGDAKATWIRPCRTHQSAHFFCCHPYPVLDLLKVKFGTNVFNNPLSPRGGGVMD